MIHYVTIYRGENQKENFRIKTTLAKYIRKSGTFDPLELTFNCVIIDLFNKLNYPTTSVSDKYETFNSPLEATGVKSYLYEHSAACIEMAAFNSDPCSSRQRPS